MVSEMFCFVAFLANPGKDVSRRNLIAAGVGPLVRAAGVFGGLAFFGG